MAILLEAPLILLAMSPVLTVLAASTRLSPWAGRNVHGQHAG
jgi:hypothetical protein